MTNKATLGCLGLFGGALLCAGVSSTASAQALVLDDTAAYNAVWVFGYDWCPPPYDDYLQCGESVELFGDVPFLSLPSATEFSVEGQTFRVESTPTRFELSKTPIAPGTIENDPVFDAAYAEVSFTLTAAATIDYEYDFGLSGVITLGDTTLSGTESPLAGTIGLEAGDRIEIGGRARDIDRASFRVEIVTEPPCNPADLAPPFGIIDLDDIDTFIGAFVAGDPIADLGQPAGVLDLADIDRFIQLFLFGCP